MAKVLILLALVAIGVAVYFSCKSCNPPQPPNLDTEEWWGPKELRARQDRSIRSFQVKFSPEMIQDLRQRLKNRRSPTPPLESVAFQYGFNTNQLNTWTNYWAEKYNFTERERFLNKFPQFKTNIQGLDIHFIRIRPQVPAGVEVVPILLMHGWPGSVREFYEAIPLLTQHTKGYDFALEVVIPSLPGYGFSDAAVRPGLGTPHVGVIMRNLMHRLGHKKFYVQGGDWGAVIASAMATLFPGDILGHHSNMAVAETACARIRTFIGAFIPSLIVDSNLADRMYPLTSLYSYLLEESGYFHLQATKPDTIGVALSESPSGLLAYILEKFSSWTSPANRQVADGALSVRFTREQLLDNLMMYWTSQSITTSMRLYAESMSKKTRDLDINSIPSPVPTWVLQAKHEIIYQPPNILRLKYPNLLQAHVLDEGGHFLALELPQVFAEDVINAVRAFRAWHTNSQKTEL